ncbi:MAG: sigma-54 dependent transcriptional regulator [Cytophagales bacterium]|nr:sigma-54 dependent transcriptional regulator [Cytophagales bacterium]
MKSTVKIFAVEDDPTYKKFLEYVLSLNPDFEVNFFSSGNECIKHLHLKPQIIALDYTLPDLSGEEVLKKVKIFDPEIQVIIVSAQEKIGTAVQLLKLGAYDYIIKNEDTKDLLLNAVNNARKNISLTEEIHSLRHELSEKYEFEKSIIGSSKAIKKVFEMLEKAVRTNIIVSITGETGTGKELIAKTIHYNSNRKNEPFVPVNIAAIPSELIESELFGHEKGSFTGAITRRIGKFEEAQKGTIFLDEIGEMDLNLQAKLLRVIQEKEVTRIGGSNTIKLDVRVLVATHRNLADEVKNGNFREDLYYRLLGLPVWLPPLRERDNDVIIIAKYFLKEFCLENGIDELRFSKKAQDKLLKYQYPGNVRELKSVVDLAAVLTDTNEIDADDIKFNSVLDEDKLAMEELTLKEYNFKIVDHLLDKYDNNVLKVAKKLDIGKSTIYRYLKEMEELKDRK